MLCLRDERVPLCGICVADSQTKRPSKQGALAVEKRQKSLPNNEAAVEKKSMAHLLVVGERPADDSKPAPSHSVFSFLTANAAKAFQTHHFFCGNPCGNHWQAGQFTRPEYSCLYRNLVSFLFPSCFSPVHVLCRYVGSRAGASCTCSFPEVDCIS